MKNLSKTAEFLKWQKRQPALVQWLTEFNSLCNLNPQCMSNEQSWTLLGNGLLIECADKDEYLTFLKWATGKTGSILIEDQLLNLDSLKGVIGKTTKPVIIFIDSGKWLDDEDPSEEDAIKRKGIYEALGLIQGKSIVITSTCNEFGGIAEIFRYQNKFDRHIHWAPPQPESHAADFLEQFGADNVSDSLLNDQSKLGCILCLEFPSRRRFGMLEKALRRVAQREKRKIELEDILHVAINGTGEGLSFGDHADTNQIAAHEAGHAVVSMVESNFQYIPDWVSIISTKEMAGVMVQDFQRTHRENSFRSFMSTRTDIRVGLAGRIAEELLLGELNVGADCANSDLRDVTKRAFNLMARSGFSSNYGANSYDGENLAVAIEGYLDKNSTNFRVEAQKFIQMQYRAVKVILNSNKSLLMAIQRGLIERRLLLKCDLEVFIDELIIPFKKAA